MIIDKMGSRVYEDSEITYIAQQEIRSKLSQAEEDNLQRKILGSLLGVYPLSEQEEQAVTAYKALLTTVQAEAAQATLDNALLRNTIAYENALRRLEQHELAVGREEQVVYKLLPDGTEEIDYIIPAIEPLEAMVETAVYSEDGLVATIVEVPNPEIVLDNMEREAASAIVANASEEVITLYELRTA